MKSKIIFLLFLCIALESCVSSQFVSIDNSKKETPQIDVYMKGLNSPKQEYEVIAYIEVSGSVFNSKNALLRELKKRAKKLGGDAVINVNYFYIPLGFSCLPALDGVLVKFK